MDTKDLNKIYDENIKNSDTEKNLDECLKWYLGKCSDALYNLNVNCEPSMRDYQYYRAKILNSIINFDFDVSDILKVIDPNYFMYSEKIVRIYFERYCKKVTTEMKVTLNELLDYHFMVSNRIENKHCCKRN